MPNWWKHCNELETSLSQSFSFKLSVVETKSSFLVMRIFLRYAAYWEKYGCILWRRDLICRNMIIDIVLLYSHNVVTSSKLYYLYRRMNEWTATSHPPETAYVTGTLILSSNSIKVPPHVGRINKIKCTLDLYWCHSSLRVWPGEWF